MLYPSSQQKKREVSSSLHTRQRGALYIQYVEELFFASSPLLLLASKAVFTRPSMLGIVSS